jgi:sporulation protein YlmC with PRC-barrel domain
MTLRLSDLVGNTVYDESGTKLGRIDEVRVKNSQVEALICGPAGRLQRMAQWGTGKRVEWRRIVSVSATAVHCISSQSAGMVYRPAAAGNSNKKGATKSR